jgi:hypothetical protein
MRWKEMRRKWPTIEAYAKDHTALEVITSRGAFVAAVVAAACLVRMANTNALRRQPAPSRGPGPVDCLSCRALDPLILSQRDWSCKSPYIP